MMITTAQVRLLRKRLMEGKTQEAAAASADMSVRSARKWDSGPLPSAVEKTRTWRTRSDPFEAVWDSDIVPLLKLDKEGKLQAGTILTELQQQYPGRFNNKHLRTLQRRIRDWRALSGPDHEVIFPQMHPPGREGAFDFTHCDSLGVIISGGLFTHLLFTFKLSYSGWTWVNIAFGETFEAMIGGLQGALWDLGGAPSVLRHDNLSAATHELKRSGGRALTRRFQDFLDHYGVSSSRINPGKSHENGVAEKSNDLIKTALSQALIVRGNRNFENIEQYLSFVRQVITGRLNNGIENVLTEERTCLRPLPSARLPEYTAYHPTVRSWSTIRIGTRVYSVPSRLIGHQVEVRQYANHLEVYYINRLVEKMPRLRGEMDARVDYRHIIRSLIRKPGAFARYRYREELFPTLTFRRVYDQLCCWRGERADVEYVRILHLAASTLESRVESALLELLESRKRFDYAAVKAVIRPEQHIVPHISIPVPDLTVYDRLLGGSR